MFSSSSTQMRSKRSRKSRRVGRVSTATSEWARLARSYSEWDSIISRLVVTGPKPRPEWIQEISETTASASSPSSKECDTLEEGCNGIHTDGNQS